MWACGVGAGGRGSSRPGRRHRSAAPARMCNPDDHEANDDGKEYVSQPTLQPGVHTLPLLQTVGAAGSSSSGIAGRLIIESFPLTFEGYTYKHGHIAYVEGRPPAPVIQVQHNYAGLKQFDIDQAAFLARCAKQLPCRV